jgi:hypothetical protein
MTIFTTKYAGKVRTGKRYNKTHERTRLWVEVTTLIIPDYK